MKKEIKETFTFSMFNSEVPCLFSECVSDSLPIFGKRFIYRVGSSDYSTREIVTDIKVFKENDIIFGVMFKTGSSVFFMF